MDYAALRQQGIRLLEQMTGGQWTDFNTSDPGITLLEQLCYVLSDLSYRIGYQIPDLLSDGGGDPSTSLYSPATILTTNPVTPDDLRRLTLDVVGVKNAWIELATDPEVALSYLPSPQELRLSTIDLSAQPVVVRGLYRVLIDPSGEISDTLLRATVAKRLHANRDLGEDFAEISVLQMQPIQVDIVLEVLPVDDAVDLLTRIRAALADTISPSVPFSSLAEMIDAGHPIDEIFEGPRLDHGFLSDQALADATRRTVVYTSDLMHAVNNVSGVRSVSRIRIAKGGAWEEWALSIDADRVAKLDPGGLTVTLRRSGKVVVTDPLPPAPIDSTDTSITTSAADNDLVAPIGRNRHAGKYSSLQQHLPSIYGIGEMGLPDSASPERKAQARQLKAYLLFFDQLLANSFAQLSHFRDLFSYDSVAQTYFTHIINQPELGLSDVCITEDGLDRRLQSLVETQDSAPALERRNRFLNHLLARFAEPIADQALAPTLAERAQQKQSLLLEYPTCSSARGTGYDCLNDNDGNNRSGLEQRLQLVALHKEDGEEVLIIEHHLLRPMKEDILYDEQGLAIDSTYPFLSAARGADPYSLQLTFVFPDGVGRFAKPEFQQFVEETVRQQLPAHLFPFIFWADAATWELIKDAHAQWLLMRQVFTANSLSVKLDGAAATTTASAINLRGARDRLIDLLGLGQTSPLADTGVRPLSLTVDFDTAVQIEINPSQVNVRYELWEGAAHVDPDYTVDGNGSAVILSGPVISGDHTYRILAYKIDRPDRKDFLLTTATVKIGLNHALPAYTPGATIDSPIFDYGTSVEVRVGNTQAGVTYRLLDSANNDITVAAGLGNGAQISLFTVPMLEDTKVRIAASRDFDSGEGRTSLATILDPVLSLAIRPNPAATVTVKSSQICDYQGTATLQIGSSQASVVYTAYVRSLVDADFVPTAVADSGILIVQVAGSADVQVTAPSRPAIWTVPSGYTQLAQSAGNGGTLELALAGLTEDSLVVVQAHKDHMAVAPVKSDLQLIEPQLILVRPSLVPELLLQLTVNTDGMTGELLVQNGQPGIFYYFRRGSEADLIGLPAYFHRLDDSQPGLGLNKGVEQMRLETDLVIARDETATADLTKLTPLPPLVDVSLLPLDGTLTVLAVKARTNIAWSTSHSVAVTTTS